MNFERRVFCAIFRRFEIPREDFISMENEKWRFFQNGSLKFFDFWFKCLGFYQNWMGKWSGFYCLLYDPVLTVERRVNPDGMVGYFILGKNGKLWSFNQIFN